MYNTLGSEKSFALYNGGKLKEIFFKNCFKEGRQNKLAQKGRNLKKEKFAWGKSVKQFCAFAATSIFWGKTVDRGRTQ